MGEVLGVCGRDPMTAVSWLDSKRGARMLLKHPALTIIGSLTLAPAIAIGLVGAPRSPEKCCTNEWSWNP